MQHIEEAWSSHLPPYLLLVYMTLEVACSLQDHVQSDDRYLCFDQSFKCGFFVNAIAPILSLSICTIFASEPIYLLYLMSQSNWANH
jgi:hypothetical protein